jgi:hypothetical protein
MMTQLLLYSLTSCRHGLACRLLSHVSIWDASHRSAVAQGARRHGGRCHAHSTYWVYADPGGGVVALVLWHEAARPDDHVQRQWAKNADLKPGNRNVDLIDRGCPKVAPVFLWLMRRL